MDLGVMAMAMEVTLHPPELENWSLTIRCSLTHTPNPYLRGGASLFSTGNIVYSKPRRQGEKDSERGNKDNLLYQKTKKKKQ